jgi:hypothetical protein
MIAWVRNPIYPSFYRLRGYGLHERSNQYDCIGLKLYLYLPYLQDLIIYIYRPIYKI